MTESNERATSLIRAWLSATNGERIPAGLPVNEAVRRAGELRDSIRAGSTTPNSYKLTAENTEILHALCFSIRERIDDHHHALAEAARAYAFVESVDWPEKEPYGDRQEILADVAFGGWRAARGANKSAEVEKWLRRFRASHLSTVAGLTASRIFSDFVSGRRGTAPDPGLYDPHMLLSLLELMRSRIEADPRSVRMAAASVVSSIERTSESIGHGDEREYFLAELALIAGCACRFLFDRVAARRWFDRSEATFNRVINARTPVMQAARLAYQKLALAVEERRFAEVLELVPVWVGTLELEELWEDALKCRLLEAAALREVGQMPRAVTVMRGVFDQAEELGYRNLTAVAAGNLAQFYRVLGDLRQALAYAQKALPLLEGVKSRVSLVKLRWCVGDILREEGKLAEAIEAYREALREAREIGTRGDVVAIHLVLADVLLAAGQDRQAEWEIRAALPIIDEEKMVPEGYAALSLLRQSLQSHRINGDALKNLHGYFRDSES